MKTTCILLVWLVVMTSISCQKKSQKTTPAALETQEQKFSYIMGMKTAQDMKGQGMLLDSDSFAMGFKDNFSGGKIQIKEDEINSVLQKFQEERRSQIAMKNREEEELFLQKNLENPDVKATPTGLQYKVLQEGKGPMPKPLDSVKVHYKGTFLDGSEFDSSYKRNAPATFPLNGVIPGWTEGLQLMRVGSRYQFFVPSRLAYGDEGAGDMIPPAKMLIFEVELLEVTPIK